MDAAAMLFQVDGWDIHAGQLLHRRGGSVACRAGTHRHIQVRDGVQRGDSGRAGRDAVTELGPEHHEVLPCLADGAEAVPLYR
jgi:hypothetical protein